MFCIYYAEVLLRYLRNRNTFYMGSHLSHKNLKRSRKIIGTPEVGLFPGKLV